MQTSVDVYLSEFPDEEVLEAALDLITGKRKLSAESARIVADMRDHFLSEAEEGRLPPISTAAKIHTLEDLDAWLARQPQLFRFPSEPVPV